MPNTTTLVDVVLCALLFSPCPKVPVFAKTFGQGENRKRRLAGAPPARTAAAAGVILRWFPSWRGGPPGWSGLGFFLFGVPLLTTTCAPSPDGDKILSSRRRRRHVSLLPTTPCSPPPPSEEFLSSRRRRVPLHPHQRSFSPPGDAMFPPLHLHQRRFPSSRRRRAGVSQRRSPHTTHGTSDFSPGCH